MGLVRHLEEELHRSRRELYFLHMYVVKVGWMGHRGEEL